MTEARTYLVCCAAIVLAAAGGCTRTIASTGSAGNLAAVLDAQSTDRVGLVENFSAEADLDGDGVNETIRLAWLSGGGSGTYDHLVVSDSGSDLFIYSAPLGDRVQVRGAEVRGDTLIVETLQAGPGDAMCCAGQKYRREFALRNGEFVEIGTVDEGRISIADLAGEWRLLSLDRGEALPPDITITLAFDGNRIGGSSGCNRYMGLVAPGEPPRGLQISGALAGTRMACAPPVDAIEGDYLGKLEKLFQFGFMAGNLVISWGDDQERGLLTYRRAD